MREVAKMAKILSLNQNVSFDCKRLEQKYNVTRFVQHLSTGAVLMTMLVKAE